MTAPPRVDVLTFGCRLNIVESDTMRREALRAGHRDLTIVNTCAVTAEAVRNSRQAIRRARRDHPHGRLVATGCATEIDTAGFEAMPGVDAVVPNRLKTGPESWGSKPQIDGIDPPAQGRSDFTPWSDARHSRGFVEIQNGCDHRCTFCVIPLGRGDSRSIEPEAVLARVRALVAQGVREVVLTGVDVTSYAARVGSDFALGELVSFLLRSVPELPRLRLSSLDCIEADPVLLALIASEPRLMPHLHLSLQSGSDLVLKRMKRRHSRHDAIAFCNRLQTLRPDLVFGADLIAGFPTETDAMFAETLDLVEACGISYVHAFPYSPRPSTPAARMPQVPSEVIRERSQRLRGAGDARLSAHLDKRVGRTVTVLTERGRKGRAEDFTAVRLPDDSDPGLLQAFRIDGHDGKVAFGSVAGR